MKERSLSKALSFHKRKFRSLTRLCLFSVPTLNCQAFAQILEKGSFKSSS